MEEDGQLPWRRSAQQARLSIQTTIAEQLRCEVAAPGDRYEYRQVLYGKRTRKEIEEANRRIAEAEAAGRANQAVLPDF